MTKTELTRQIQQALPFDITQKEVSAVLTAAFDIVKKYLLTSDDDEPSFNIRGFGTLFRMSYGGHEFYNPLSGKREMMAIKRTIKFTCSKVFKKKL